MKLIKMNNKNQREDEGTHRQLKASSKLNGRESRPWPTSHDSSSQPKQLSKHRQQSADRQRWGEYPESLREIEIERRAQWAWETGKSQKSRRRWRTKWENSEFSSGSGSRV